MKKSEKIEIRLSHADKTNLAELAKKEGHTVSEFVRRILQRYVEFNTTAIATRFPMMKILIATVVSFFAGALLAYGMVKNKKPQTYKPQHYWLKTTINLNPMYITIPMQDGFTTDFEIPDYKGNINVKIRLDRDEQSIPYLHMDFCRVTKTECQSIANPKLLISKKDVSTLSFYGKGQELIKIEIGPS